tara:strand:- start:874 stop:1287 length:414 start_codon:yes stop_codon:yes gene_type:complete
LSNKISNKDKKDWENFLSNKESVFDKDNFSKKKERINEFTFDLHGFSLNEANKQVEQLIYKSYEAGVRRLIIITGKGLHSENEKDPYVSKDLGKLRYSVPDHIRKSVELMKKINNLEDAEIDHGGEGAFYINLKKKL